TMRTRPCASLGAALLTTTTPEYFIGDDAQRFEALSQAVRLKRYGGDCYNYCMLALGQIDLVVEAGLNPYDIIPLIPIVERSAGPWRARGACPPLGREGVRAPAGESLPLAPRACMEPP